MMLLKISWLSHCQMYFYFMRLLSLEGSEESMYISSQHYSSREQLFKLIYSFYHDKITTVYVNIHMPGHWITGIIFLNTKKIYLLDSLLPLNINLEYTSSSKYIIHFRNLLVMPIYLVRSKIDRLIKLLKLMSMFVLYLMICRNKLMITVAAYFH